MPRRALLAAAMLVATLMVAATPAQADLTEFGVFHTAGDVDDPNELEAVGPDTFTHLDGDSDGIVDPGEPVYLTRDSQRVQVTDIRITETPLGLPGTFVRSHDNDKNDAVTPLEASIAYFDEDGTGSFTAGDPVYLDLDAPGNGRVSLGDVVLAGAYAGHVVESHFPSFGLTLTPLTATVLTWDVNDDDGWDTGDRIYLDVDGNEQVTVPDVRLGNPRDDRFGSYVQPAEADATPELTTANVPTSFLWLDNDANERPDPGEPVYLSSSGTRIVGAAIRLAEPMVGELGSTVASGDADHGKSAASLDATLSFHDKDADGSVDPGETVYLDLDDASTGEVSIGDVILSGAGAGTIIDAGHDALEDPLTVVPGSLAAWDAQGDDRYSAGDAVYLDSDDDATISIGDLKLSRHASYAPVPSDDELSAAADVLEGQATTDQGSQEQTSEDPGAERDEEPEPEPGPDADDGDEDAEDEEARRKALEAKQEALEARKAAREAKEEAQQAKDAAQGAKDTAEGSNAKLDDLLAAQGNGTGEGALGVPGPGPGLILLTTLSFALARGARRER